MAYTQQLPPTDTTNISDRPDPVPSSCCPNATRRCMVDGRWSNDDERQDLIVRAWLSQLSRVPPLPPADHTHTHTRQCVGRPALDYSLYACSDRQSLPQGDEWSLCDYCSAPSQFSCKSYARR